MGKKKYKTEEERVAARKLSIKKYYDNNREKINKRQNERRKINSLTRTEEQKEIERVRNKNWRIANSEKKKEYDKKWRKNNLSRKNATNKKWCETNREKDRKSKKKWVKNNVSHIKNYYLKIKEKRKTPEKREKANNYTKNKRTTDILFKLKHGTRCMINKSLKNKGHRKKSRTYEILGCSFEEFKQYLESLFEPWMNWENRGLYNGTLNYGWDIDHKIPLSSAKTEEDVIKLNHYTNLRPLCSYTNRHIKRNNLF